MLASIAMVACEAEQPADELSTENDKITPCKRTRRSDLKEAPCSAFTRALQHVVAVAQFPTALETRQDRLINAAGVFFDDYDTAKTHRIIVQHFGFSGSNIYNAKYTFAYNESNPLLYSVLTIDGLDCNDPLVKQELSNDTPYRKFENCALALLRAGVCEPKSTLDPYDVSACRNLMKSGNEVSDSFEQVVRCPPAPKKGVSSPD